MFIKYISSDDKEQKKFHYRRIDSMVKFCNTMIESTKNIKNFKQKKIKAIL